MFRHRPGEAALAIGPRHEVEIGYLGGLENCLNRFG